MSVRGEPGAAERRGAPVRSPLVVALDDPRAADSDLCGAKAANLAVAAGHGFPVVPGFVLTTAAFDPADPGWGGRGGIPTPIAQELRAAWQPLSAVGDPLVVRSSSTVEDIGASSMAGQFLSRLGVRGWPDVAAAVADVQRSAEGPAGQAEPAPMAVLLQRQIPARLGGVMFGLDPVSGDRQHILVEAVPGGPEQLVSGTVTAQRYLLGRRGRVIEGPGADDGAPLLDGRDRRRLARLAGRAAAAFGRAQDIEWAIDDDDRLWLLQSRPVTAVGGSASASGPLLGPGPVGETFPDPLRPLEEDLWLTPLRRGIESALVVTGAVSRSVISTSPLVLAVGGRVACDLELLGASPDPPSGWRMLDPRIGGRRIISAWRIGRLRAVLPDLAHDVVRRVDAELAAVPDLADLSSAELLEVVQRCRGHLASVHGHEVLAGALLPQRGATAAGAAIAVVGRGRSLGLDDAEIVARWPVALALTAPRIGRSAALPPTPEPSGEASLLRLAGQLDELPAREALRLRARWLQELSGRAACALGERLARADRIPAAQTLPHLRLAELAGVVAGWPAPDDLCRRRLVPAAPLPSAFRLDADGRPVAQRFSGAHRRGGRGASPGRAQGRVVADPAQAQDGDVLVARTLDPRYAAWLPALGAVVSETGSVLSHLAILAREYGVPTVIGVHDAVQRYPVGTLLVVDGTTGEVGAASPEEEATP